MGFFPKSLILILSRSAFAITFMNFIAEMEAVILIPWFSFHHGIFSSAFHEYVLYVKIFQACVFQRGFFVYS